MFLVFNRDNSRDYSPKKHKSKHKKHSKDKDVSKKISKDDYEPGCTDSNDPCWMAPLIRVRILSKSYKNGKYYHKKVGSRYTYSTRQLKNTSKLGRYNDISFLTGYTPYLNF
jgi:hypothetical protein